MIRQHISWHAEYIDASTAKGLLDPDKQYQIRRKQRRFELVERVAGNIERKEETTTLYSKRRKRERSVRYQEPS